jgi:hypothetical protein
MIVELSTQVLETSNFNREANKAAHELARYSYTEHVGRVWDDDPPSFLYPKLINDVSIFENQ